MAQFDRNEWFEFNGFRSQNRYMICTKDSSDMTSQFGVNRSIVEEDGVKSQPVFYGVTETCPELEVQITKIKNGDIAPFRDEDLMELTRILFKTDYAPLVVNGLVYYVIFTNGSNWRVGSGHGVITLTMRMATPHAFSSIIVSNNIVNESRIIDVYNKSTYCGDLYPDIEFELLGDSAELKITNISTNEVMEFKELTKNERVYVYNDGLKQAISKVDATRNIFEKISGKWLKLRYGKNTIKFECENCKIKILYQNKISLY